LQAAVKRSVESLFGLVLHNGYGITECSPTIAQTRVEQPRSDLSAGPVLPEVEVKLVDSERRPAPAGGIGELWVRGPNVMKGYYRAPEETAAVIDADGWFNTRDLARLEDENLFVVGRSKDIIIRRGFNVYPPEVEAVLNDHPAVIQSAVIGQTIPGDEEIIAFVQTVPAARITSAELSEHAARRLAAYKRPSQIVFVAAMPTTPTGKIQKNLLRAQLESNTVQIDGLASPIPGS
jgi:acyl-CoA synthetase (AMP-forming)/AMP-acid ligase II